MLKINIFIGKCAAWAVFAAAALFNPLLQAHTVAPAPAKTASNAMHGMTSPMPMSGNMDMKTMMRGMNDKMSAMPMSGNTDIDFAMMMREHHVGAIDMARAQLQNGKEPQMRKLAKEIVAAQKKEIATIDKFLATHSHAAGKMSK